MLSFGRLIRRVPIVVPILLGCLSGAAVAPASPAVTHQSQRQDDWRLTIARDTFSGERACRLWSRDGRALYRSGGVGFQFRRGKSVAGAVYRIDGGDLHASRDDLPRLIQSNTPIDHGSMADPSGGVVWVPYALLTQASTIAIETRRGERARVFHLRGLVALHDIAVAGGCAPESRFVAK